ncbi:MAG: zinc-ribbon domain-containing protein [Bacilli bacterium]|nr:zinc-ribbon domain-containing protein [Bacilli bacterium]
MVCKNCGNELKENERFCTMCGTFNDPNDDDDIPVGVETFQVPTENPTIENPEEEFPEIDEFKIGGKTKEEKPKKEKVKKERPPKEEYVPVGDPNIIAYIGEDYRWIVDRPFNIYALLLSFIYFLYRKMYLIGFLGLLLSGFVVKLFPIATIPYIALVMIGSGFLFNKIYLDTVERKVNKIVQNAEPGEDVAELCRKKGGVNVFTPFLFFFLFLIIMFLSYVRIMPFYRTSKYWSANSDNLANCKRMGRNVYENLGETVKNGELEELICEIIIGTDKKHYNFYLKMVDNGQLRYLYYEDNGRGFEDLRGSTDFIEDLEKTKEKYGLADSDQEFLDTSKDLPNKFDALKDDASYEDKAILNGKDTKEKTHFRFNKDDLYR